MKFLIYIACLFPALCSCSSKKEKLISGITALQLTTDSIAADLSEINAEKTIIWHDAFLNLKNELIIFAAKDTIPQTISNDFDSYITALSTLEGFPQELEKCKTANDSLKTRLKLLKADIENQLGERSLYDQYFQKEKREAGLIRKHSKLLKEAYLNAENAQGQFLPVIERFIRTFVIE